MHKKLIDIYETPFKKMCKTYTFLILALFLSVVELPMQAQELVKIDDEFDFLSLDKKKIIWYADSSKTLKLQDILQKDLKPLPQLNLGYNPAKHWFKVELDVKDIEQEVFLELSGLFEITNLYLQNGKTWKIQKSGIWNDFRDRKVKYRHFVFPLKFEKKGKYILYIEIYAQASVYVEAKLHNHRSFEQQIIWEECLYGIFYGAMLITFFYNLFLFFSLKDLTYLYYCIFLVLSLWLQFIIIGHYLYFFGNHSYWIERSDQFVFLFLVANYWLCISFLETRKNHKSIHNIFLFFLLINLILGVIGFFLPITLILTLTSLSVLIAVLITLISGVILFFKGVKQARFFIIAWIAYLLAATSIVLKNSGILPSNFFTENSLQLGSITQILFLSFALSDKINILRIARNKAEKKSRELSEKNKEMLKEQNKVLEQKVKERTQELQNSNQELQVLNEELHQNQEEIVSQRDFLNKQNKLLDRKNFQIESSIRAAEAIQQAILPYKEKLDSLLKDYFVINLPKDVVSGDFYWLNEIDGKIVLIVADCTGHGVPGAFMTLIGVNLLDKIVRLRNITNPADILEELHKEIHLVLKQEYTNNNDGMDASAIIIEKVGDKNKITFSGAKNHLFYFSSEENKSSILKGTRKSIGGIQNETKQFQNHELILSQGSFLYLGSDGLEDQNNAKRKNFGRNKVKSLIQEVYHLSPSKQKQAFENALKEHMQDTLQRDDILWMGIRL